MKNKKYHSELGVIKACTTRLAEAGVDGAKRGVEGDSWFGSVEASDELGQKDIMSVIVVSSSVLCVIHYTKLMLQVIVLCRTKHCIHYCQKRSSRCFRKYA